jgi:Prokaryotic phospholipase A2
MKRIATFVMFAAFLVSCNQTPTPQTVTLNDVPSLTKEQIRGLTETQLDALGREANTNLERATQRLAPQTAIAWPDFGSAFFVAASVTYEVYLANYYQQTNGPDWSDDGCSGPTPPVIFDDNACRQHDFGYRNVSSFSQGRTENVRESIDQRFLSNMYLRCNRRWDSWYEVPLRVACKGDALIFYGAVRNFGRDAFYSNPVLYP